MKAPFFLLLLALLAGCAGGMIPGKLFSVSEATTLEFQIEKSRGTGKMTATNPKTGEKFEGQYTGIMHGQRSTFTTGYNYQTGQTASATSISPPTYATARGVLMGDKGTVIELFMEIQPGIKPRGHGDGTDNKGGRYQVQF